MSDTRNSSLHDWSYCSDWSSSSESELSDDSYFDLEEEVAWVKFDPSQQSGEETTPSGWALLNLESGSSNDAPISEEDSDTEEFIMPPTIVINLPNNPHPHTEYVIDPTHMSPQEALIATQFLISQLQEYNEILTEHDKPYQFKFKDPVADKKTNTIVKFTYDIANYADEEHPNQKCFAVVGKTCVGKGGESVINKVKGRLLSSNAGTLFYQSDKNKPKEEKWVARYETHRDFNSKIEAIGAYQLAKNNKKLGLTYPMWTSADKTKRQGMSINLMHRLKEYDLEKVEDKDEEEPGYLDKIIQHNSRWDLCEIIYLLEKKKIHLSDLAILKYCLAIAIAYKEQVQDLGLVHRDIKPENIIIDLAKGPVPEAITIIDYSFAIKIGTFARMRICGTAGYIAPEMLEGKNPSHNSYDIFALMCTFASLLGDDSVSVSDEYYQACNRMFELDEKTPLEINLLLHSGVARSPYNRPEITEIIETLKTTIAIKESNEATNNLSLSSKR